MGVAASQMERQGIQTEKGNVNRQITADNKLLKELKALFRSGKIKKWYVRDCSRKQKAQYQVRGRSGKPVTNTIPYGFKKDPEMKHYWLVNEEAAAVVRRIFQLNTEGYGPGQIAMILMKDKVERPSYYLAQRGRGTRQSTTDLPRPYNWTNSTIRSILEKPKYMGHTVNFRACKPSYKEWLIFENIHEAIVDPETRKPGSWPRMSGKLCAGQTPQG